MGMLVDGTWQDKWYDTSSTGGRFVRQGSAFRAQVAPGGAHPPEAGRYHLYVAQACPWAHRTVLMRTLKGLEGAISLSVVHPNMLEHGWSFDDTHPDHLFGSQHLYQVYLRADPRYTGRVTVPVLWDRQAGTIVNNESSEILRMLDGAFEPLGDPSAPLHGVPMYPEDLRATIDEVNHRVYETVNNGVYRAGFATTQEAYDEAVTALFDSLEWLEALLGRQPWLAGDRLTEADWRLFTTMLRFDLVYHVHFKCSRKRLVDLPNLYDHTRALYQVPGVVDTIDVGEIRQHYFYSHPTVNPHRIVPIAPVLDLSAPAERTAALPPQARPR